LTELVEGNQGLSFLSEIYENKYVFYIKYKRTKQGFFPYNIFLPFFFFFSILFYIPPFLPLFFFLTGERETERERERENDLTKTVFDLSKLPDLGSIRNISIPDHLPV